MPEYTIRKSIRAKNIRITVRPDETVTITVPHAMSVARAEQFIREKSGWIERSLQRLRRRPKPAYTLPKASRRDYEAYKGEAYHIALERLAHFGQLYGFSWKRISIKNTTSRWGSCSKLGNINFSYRIAFLPPHLQDYLIVHELCHLGEMNHSPRFWELVARTIPKYVDARRDLKSIP